MAMNKKLFISMAIAIVVISCKQSGGNTMISYRESANKTIKLKEKIKGITTNLYLGFGEFNIFDEYFIYNDFKTQEGKLIYLFNKNTFELIRNFGISGRGPGEITRLGSSHFYDNTIWVDDYAKNVKWAFPLDSVLYKNDFLPKNKLELNQDLFLTQYDNLNDTIGVGIAVKPLTYHSMDQIVAKLNYNSNIVEPYGYQYPGLKENQTYSSLCMSGTKDKYVRCYRNLDLITICNADGTLVTNVVGEQWENIKKEHSVFYFGVNSYKNYFLVSYLGDEYVHLDKDKGIESTYPSKLLAFNFKGEYIKTLDIGKGFSSFCVDEDNKRAILFFEDQEEPFGYVNLEL